MGFPSNRAKRALLATGNSDTEAAMMWALEHAEDPGELAMTRGTQS
jgi:ubiquitin carboxyl-terminal hydrolase 5/13